MLVFLMGNRFYKQLEGLWEKVSQARPGGGAWRGWVIPVAAVAAGGLYAILPGVSSFLGPEPDLASTQAPSDRAGWVALNRKALRETLKGDPEGAGALARMLEWNRRKRFGVDLRGVELAEIFRAAEGPPGEGNLFDYLRRGGPESLGKFMSLRHCDITGAKHPGVTLRGLDMSDVRVDLPTIEQWARTLKGRGLMGVNLSGVGLHGVNLDGCRLGGADLSYTGVDVRVDPEVPGKFNATRLLGLDLVGRDLRGLSLKRCDLRMTAVRAGQLADVAKSLRGGGLRGAVLPSVDMVFEDMDGVGLQFANLRLANFGQRQIRQVEGNMGGTGLYGAKLKDHQE